MNPILLEFRIFGLKHERISQFMNVLSVYDLRKQFSGLTAVDGVSFDVGKNEIVGLLGPNGAGKTTTINMILGVLEPTSGSIRIEDVDLKQDRRAALRRTNFA